jgi:hypothetical protein
LIPLFFERRKLKREKEKEKREKEKEKYWEGRGLLMMLSQ